MRPHEGRERAQAGRVEFQSVGASEDQCEVPATSEVGTVGSES